MVDRISSCVNMRWCTVAWFNDGYHCEQTHDMYEWLGGNVLPLPCCPVNEGKSMHRCTYVVLQQYGDLLPGFVETWRWFICSFPSHLPCFPQGLCASLSIQYALQWDCFHLHLVSNVGSLFLCITIVIFVFATFYPSTVIILNLFILFILTILIECRLCLSFFFFFPFPSLLWSSSSYLLWCLPFPHVPLVSRDVPLLFTPKIVSRFFGMVMQGGMLSCRSWSYMLMKEG